MRVDVQNILKGDGVGECGSLENGEISVYSVSEHWDLIERDSSEGSFELSNQTVIFILML